MTSTSTREYFNYDSTRSMESHGCLCHSAGHMMMMKLICSVICNAFLSVNTSYYDAVTSYMVNKTTINKYSDT